MATPQKSPGYVDPAYLQKLAAYVAPLKRRSFEAMRITAGQRVLDVGCGPATDTIPLAKLVGAQGLVVGIDYDTEMVALAEQKALEAGVSDRVIHKVADATVSIPYPVGYFDSCRSERVFQHVKQSDTLLDEMIRVTKPGGRVVVLDTDQASMALDTTYTDLMWRMARFRAETYANGLVGRQLPRLFKQHRLKDVQVEVIPLWLTDYTLARYFAMLDRAEAQAVAAGIVTAAELDRLRGEFQHRDAEGTFFAYINLMLVVGIAP
jgi:ubiquinone/menaquinone biosynthesis C-methylase UbiE